MDVGTVDFASLDGEDDLLGLAAALVVEEKATINPFVRSFLRVSRSSADETQGPPLELVGVCSGKFFGVVKSDGLPDDLIGLIDLRPVGVLEPVLDEVDRKVRNVDSDPASPQTLRSGDGCSAATERVQDNRVLFAAADDDPFEQR